MLIVQKERLSLVLVLAIMMTIFLGFNSAYAASNQKGLAEIEIGGQNQTGVTITISEIKPETLVNGTIEPAELTITAPAGVSFAKLPTVKTTGGLSIGTVTRIMGADGTRNNVIIIPVRSTSDQAASIEISNLFFSVDRTVPEGDLVLQVSGSAVDQAQITNRTTALEIVAAKIITPASGKEIINGEFKIGSDIYYKNSAARVMDAVPYIKGGRTYVPMRYLGDILGAEVIWNENTRTITLTRGETKAVFADASSTYTVDGETRTMDAAPEIINGRTMLPARYAAEAYGAVVGWDAMSRTIVIQNK